MFNPDIEPFIKEFGEQFAIVRSGTEVAQYVGVRNHTKRGGRAYVGFRPGTDIRDHDILRSQVSGEQLHIIESRLDVVGGQPFQQMAFYKTDRELRDEGTATVTTPPTFHIENATNSIIGTQASATINIGASLTELRAYIDELNSPDAAELCDLVDAVEAMVTGNQQPEQGILGRFFGVMQRNSWITGPIGAALVTWLTHR